MVVQQYHQPEAASLVQWVVLRLVDWWKSTQVTIPCKSCRPLQANSLLTDGSFDEWLENPLHAVIRHCTLHTSRRTLGWHRDCTLASMVVLALCMRVVDSS